MWRWGTEVWGVNKPSSDYDDHSSLRNNEQEQGWQTMSQIQPNACSDEVLLKHDSIMAFSFTLQQQDRGEWLRQTYMSVTET